MRKVLAVLLSLLPIIALADVNGMYDGVTPVTGAAAWYNASGAGANGGTASFNAYCASKGLSCTSGDQHNNIQNFLLDVYVLRQSLGSFGSADSSFTGQNSTLTAILEPATPSSGTTIVVPEGITLNDMATLYRNGTVTETAPCTSTNFDGSNCGNLSAASNGIYQPLVLAAKGAQIQYANIFAKDSSGANAGSGIAEGRSWEIGGIRAIKGTVTGYTNGETCTIANPSKMGYAAQATCTVAAGNLTAVTLVSSSRWSVNNGVYTLPPALQSSTYSRADFIAATGKTTFDATQTPNNDCYIVTGATSGAHGACVTVSWWPDWCSGAGGGSGNSTYISCTSSTTYEGFFSQQNTIISTNDGTVQVQFAGTTTDAVQYGPMYSRLFAGQNGATDHQQTAGGYWGLYTTVTDLFFDRINPEQNSYCARLEQGNVRITQLICDSDTIGGIKLGKEGAVNGFGIPYFDVFRNASDAALTDYCLDASLGTNNTSGVSGLVASGTCANTGKGINVDLWSSGNDLTVTFQNFKGNKVATANQITTPITFGANNLANGGNLINCVADNISGSLISGTPPVGFGLNCWDSAAPGWMDYLGTYRMFNSGTPTNGASGTGLNKALIGSTLTDTTNGSIYINRGSATNLNWQPVGMQPHLQPQTGRFYTEPASGFSTSNNGATGVHAQVTCMPIFQSTIATPTSLAFEVTVANGTATYNADMALYTDNAGQPGTLVIDVGATATGTITVGSAFTGVEIQAIPGGNQAPTKPGWYWDCLQVTAPGAGTVAGVFRSTNLGSPGPIANADFGWSLTQGVASGSQAAGITYTAPSAALTAFPNALTSWSASAYSTSNIPIVWTGY